ncbi:MurR/RpiR family transcriptional regulator [Weissella bombi]|uniref:Transcriptional regulator, RpiR family n=1 Tax=Weissella bombi TaxID=1505725 RepID=A0A1C4BXL5_9LACO|nr:MurR/RpiR family transcriptional regulator [Weissella bombi]SCC11494.1 transcriptional regulator, RpiR family [Weissella bombi]
MSQSGFARIRSIFEHLTGSDSKIATFILDNPAEIRSLTIQELANAIGVSTATISRFVKRVGFTSFREFSLSLASSPIVQNNFFGEIDPTDDQTNIVHKVFSGAENALDATVNLIKPQTWSTATKWLLEAETIGIFGVGGSSIVALDAYHKFLRTPLHVEQHPDYDVQLMQTVHMTDKDIAIVISHSGRNHNTLNIARRLKEKNIKIIAITAYPKSELAKLASVTLASVAEEVNIRSESMSSLIAQIAIVDSLFTLIGVHLGDKTQSIVDKTRLTIEASRE